MNLHELLKLKCKIYYDGFTFVGCTGEFYSDVFKDIREYPIETFKDLPFETRLMVGQYFHKVINLTDLRQTLERKSGINILTKNRHINILYVRQLFYVMGMKMGYSLNAIGREVNKNHASVLNGKNQFLDLVNDKQVRSFYLKIIDEDELNGLIAYLNRPKSDIPDFKITIKDVILNNK